MKRPLFTPIEASKYLETAHGLRVAVRTLAKWRSTSSTGPIFVKQGRAVYYVPDGLDEYATASISQPMRSTSDPHHPSFNHPIAA